MRAILLGLVLGCILCAPTATGAPKWKRIAEVDEVTIEIRRLIPSELKKIHDKYGHEGRHEGLAVLMRMSDGTHRCEIYLASDTAVGALDHEKKHCRGWVH